MNQERASMKFTPHREISPAICAKKSNRDFEGRGYIFFMGVHRVMQDIDDDIDRIA